MESEIQVLRRDVARMRNEIEEIKDAVFDETELTEWAKKELEIARNEDPSTYTDLEDL